MNATEFETALSRDGYTEIGTSSRAPLHATQPHAHEFDVRALVIDGEITLRVGDQATRYGPGEVFAMAKGREHAESVGPDGVTTVSGRRHAA